MTQNTYLQRNKDEYRKLGIVQRFIAYAQGLEFSAIFTMFSRLHWRELLDNVKPLHYLLFPIAAFFDVLTGIASVYKLLTTRNRNILAWSDAILQTVKAALVVTAVAGALLAPAIFHALLTPVLFVAAMGMMFIDQVVRASINLFQYFRFSQKKYGDAGKEACEQYLKNFTQNIVHAFILGMIVSTLLVLMVIPGVAPIVGMVMALATASVIALKVFVGIGLWLFGSNEKSSAKVGTVAQVASEQSELQKQHTEKFDNASGNLYRRSLAAQVKQLKSDGKDDAAKELLKQNINALKKAHNDNASIKSELNSVKHRFINHKNKNTTRDTFYNYEKGQGKTLFAQTHNFFRQKSRMQELVDAVYEYLPEEASGNNVVVPR